MAILVFSAPKQAAKVKNIRSKAQHAREEELLALWVSERRRRGFNVTGEDLIVQASEVYTKLWDREQEANGQAPDRPREWEPSSTWVDDFKRRWGIRQVKQFGESRSADTLAALVFSQDFQKFVEEGGYDWQNIYNADETGLFWKQLPDRTLAITIEEVKAKG